MLTVALGGEGRLLAPKQWMSQLTPAVSVQGKTSPWEERPHPALLHKSTGQPRRGQAAFPSDLALVCGHCREGCLFKNK